MRNIKVILACAAMLFGLFACGKSADEKALDNFKGQLTSMGYNVQGGEWVTEEGESKKKKAAPKSTSPKTSSKATAAPKPTAKPKAANPKDRSMQVIVLERGCRVEAERKAGSNDFEIDEAQNNAGEEIEIDDFPGLNPDANKTRGWLDENKDRFDCYKAA